MAHDMDLLACFKYIMVIIMLEIKAQLQHGTPSEFRKRKTLSDATYKKTVSDRLFLRTLCLIKFSVLIQQETADACLKIAGCIEVNRRLKDLKYTLGPGHQEPKR